MHLRTRRAGLRSVVAYKKADYESDFEQFKELAELGQPEAQPNLAIMRANGKGVGENNAYTHARA